MSNSFEPSVNFLSQTLPAGASRSTFIGPGGRGSQAFMTGEDGNAYFPVYGAGGSSIAAQVVCGNTGAIITISYSKFVTDGGASSTNSYACLPANGTKYFWLLSIDPDPDHSLSWRYTGVLYKIVNTTTVTPVNSFDYRTLIYDGEFQDTDVYSCYTFGNSIVIVANQTGDNILTARTGIGSFSLVEGAANPFSGWSLPSKLTPDFFNYAYMASKAIFNSFTLVPDNSATGYHYLIYISKDAYNYISANLGVSSTYATFTRPGVYKYSGPFNSVTDTITDVTDAFGLPDISTHLDNTTSTDKNDDYYGCVPFSYHGVQYVAFTRSYSLTADLFTSTVGTYVHIVVYAWDGEVATKVYDTHTGLFNSHLDTGGSIGDGYPPLFVLSGISGDNLYYLWSDFNSLGYVIGEIVALTFTPDPVFNSYFSNFHDSTYTDWVSSNTVGDDFDSFITTYWVLSDDTALWMEMPWVITYLDNTQTNPSCLFTPKWDWTDVDWNHHSGPTEDVYFARSKQAVSDKRTRVRGRGRALQLTFESNTGQPFNLLGWSVTNDRNATP